MADIQTYQRELESRLWDMANTLRGSMEAYEFKNYILGIHELLHADRSYDSYY